MANKYYGCEFQPNGPATSLTTGSSSTAALDVELRVTYDATGNSKQQVLNAIDAIRAGVIQDTFPPA